MGQRGPSKKPTELKILQGIPGGKHKLTPNEPKPEQITFAKPPYKLGKEEQRVWRSVAPQLEVLGLLTKIDLRALARYCEVYAKYMKAKAVLDEKGFYYPIFHQQTQGEMALGRPPKLKYLQQFPEVAICSNLRKELRCLEGEFGMTPAARAGISVNPQASSGQYRSPLKQKLYGG